MIPPLFMPSAFSAHSKALQGFLTRLYKSRFFTVSVLIHAIIVMVLGGTVLFNKYVEPPDFTGGEGEGGFVSPEQAAQPPQQQAPPQQPTFTVTAPTNAAPINAITTTSLTQATFIPPTLATPVIDATAKTLAQPTPSSTAFSGGMSKEVAKGIAGFSGGWAKGGSGGTGSSLKSREFQFTAYLAKYAGGDWDSTIWYAKLAGKQEMRGSLPNLLWFMSKDSRNKIKADPDPVPLDLSSEEIFSKKPPFIFFTGHRDFKLTDKEVENLQKYIRLGGAIWGDSSVPGRRSRFDIAFRREMRRVVPDVDKDFEALPASHDIFTKRYYQEIIQVPQGINFYTEPVYALKIYGEIAVLYTSNDYGDMWQFGLNDKGGFEGGRDENNRMVAMNEGLSHLRGFYIRNIEPASVLATYKFGTNIIIHLLTRWEDKVRNVPKSL
jgi:hypothetical protein